MTRFFKESIVVQTCTPKMAEMCKHITHSTKTATFETCNFARIVNNAIGFS